MKIIIVGMINSIHIARWVKHLHRFKKLEVYIFPIFPAEINKLLYNISSIKDKKSNIHLITLSSNKFINIFFQKFLYLIFKNNFYLYWLKKNIHNIKPKFIHSHELTTASILCLKLKILLKNSFPLWIVSNWGSDIYFFFKKKKLKNQIEKIIKLANFYSAECHRDYILAQKIKTKVKFLKCVLNSGGINTDLALKLRNKIVPSSRKIIIMKGYQGIIGLGLVALKALIKISSELQGYKIYIYSADLEVINYIKKNKKKINLDIKIYSIKNKIDAEQMYKFFSISRVYIGISKSDGVSTSCLEAMALGAFPIQSNTSCADEWIKNNKNGYLVKNNISLIAKCIMKAIRNDNLVDSAAKTNWKIIRKRADSIKHKKIIRSFYK